MLCRIFDPGQSNGGYFANYLVCSVGRRNSIIEIPRLKETQALPTNAGHGDEVTLEGLYTAPNPAWPVGRLFFPKLNTSYKDTNQSFLLQILVPLLQTQTVNKKNSFITVPEIDNNFINLKIALLGLERDSCSSKSYRRRNYCKNRSEEQMHDLLLLSLTQCLKPVFKQSPELKHLSYEQLLI